MEKCKRCKDFYSNVEMSGFCSNCFIKHCETNNIDILRSKRLVYGYRLRIL